MSNRVPIFLLGGINKTYNFLGTRTFRTIGYGAIETGVKASPIFIMLGMFNYQQLKAQVLGADANQAPGGICSRDMQIRRLTLTQ